MKFSLAVTALTLSGSAAFTPLSLSSARAGTAMDMSAVESSTYTFAKSEEIFAEAQEVRYAWNLVGSFLVESNAFVMGY